jgi:ABC-type amino acid transport system permease subunit
MFLPGALSLCVVQRVQSPFARTLLAFYTAVQRVVPLLVLCLAWPQAMSRAKP